jgi:hypothetical protein
MPSIGSADGSEDGSRVCSVVSVCGDRAPVSFVFGTFEIDTSVQLKIIAINIYLI